jgi:hypothetical protein
MTTTGGLVLAPLLRGFFRRRNRSSETHVTRGQLDRWKDSKTYHCLQGTNLAQNKSDVWLHPQTEATFCNSLGWSSCRE